VTQSPAVAKNPAGLLRFLRADPHQEDKFSPVFWEAKKGRKAWSLKSGQNFSLTPLPVTLWTKKIYFTLINVINMLIIVNCNCN
jgi:hypothetical protein